MPLAKKPLPGGGRARRFYATHLTGVLQTALSAVRLLLNTLPNENQAMEKPRLFLQTGLLHFFGHISLHRRCCAQMILRGSWLTDRRDLDLIAKATGKSIYTDAEEEEAEDFEGEADELESKHTIVTA
ncbi:MAG: hypothetical protein ACUVRZ_07305 [Desulfobacca sp.]|uniref:hypothetical protein n=1 Tax=Desulfobacca sp. TaxID=2067990 RepID=UPI00404A42B6